MRYRKYTHESEIEKGRNWRKEKARELDRKVVREGRLERGRETEMGVKRNRISKERSRV